MPISAAAGGAAGGPHGRGRQNAWLGVYLSLYHPAFCHSHRGKGDRLAAAFKPVEGCGHIRFQPAFEPAAELPLQIVVRAVDQQVVDLLFFHIGVALASVAEIFWARESIWLGFLPLAVSTVCCMWYKEVKVFSFGKKSEALESIVEEQVNI